MGVDDEIAKGSGAVTFEVLADGTMLSLSPVQIGGSPVSQVSVKLTGQKKLNLVVNFVTANPHWSLATDHADWANAPFTCTQ